MIRYIHGSEDSIDVDVIYVFDKMPDFNECKKFCAMTEENRNIITIEDGIVKECYIGTPDEINNALLYTYPLHEQEYPLLIERKVERDIMLKQIRAVRGILSILSRTQYRPQIKAALKGNWSERIACLKEIDLCEIDFSELGKQFSGTDFLKVIAFQIGQARGLLEGVELYTKFDIARKYKALTSYLYRIRGDIDMIQNNLRRYIFELEKIEFVEEGKDVVYFPEFEKKFELRHETEI